jgi:hypothetical protein
MFKNGGGPAKTLWRGGARLFRSHRSRGRIAGAGKTAYLANGHSLKTFECSALGQHPDLVA